MKRIAFIYNYVPDADRIGLFVECASAQTVTAIEQALVQGGNELIPVNLRSRDQLAQILVKTGQPDFAFVIAEGILDTPDTLCNGCGAALVRQILTEFGIPSSHSSVAAMELCRHKDLTYRALFTHAVSFPWHLCLSVDSLQSLSIDSHRFPLFVKPSGGGNSFGIDAGSVVYSSAELVKRIQEQSLALGSVNFVAETFLPGSEYTVGVIGNSSPVVLPALAFADNRIRSSAVKREGGNESVHIIEPREPLYFRLRELALNTFSALGCADVIRVDIKSDVDGNLYVIDVNGTPSLAPSASLARMAAAAGLDYTGFVNLLLFFGLQRAGLAGSMPEQVREAEEKLNTLRRQEHVA